MPNWKTHLEVAKRVNKYLKFKDKDYDIFMIANIIPDINSSEIIENVSKYIPHEITHLQRDKEKTYIKFKKMYNNKIKEKDSLYWGYFLHLFVDFTWNQNYYHKVSKLEKKPSSEKLKDIKHNDFKVLNNKYLDNSINIDDKDIIKRTKEISLIDINYKDLEKVKKFLDNQTKYEGKLKFYKKGELEKLLRSTTYEFINTYILHKNRNSKTKTKKIKKNENVKK